MLHTMDRETTLSSRPQQRTKRRGRRRGGCEFSLLHRSMGMVRLAVVVAALAALVMPNVAARSATAFVDMRGVFGTIEFSQATNTSDLQINISLSGLWTQYESSWRVAELPISNGCRKTGATYMTDNVNGDLSSMFGDLPALSVDKVFSTSKLTLFGKESIIGRSIVITKLSKINRETICENIAWPGPTTSVTATLNGPLYGIMRFTQPLDDFTEATSIEVHIRRLKNDAGSARHNFAIYSKPTDFMLSDLCRVVGNRWDGATSSDDCTTDQLGWNSCSIGDLSGKHGMVDVPAHAFYTDTNLPLQGPDSIAGRSLVVFDKNGGTSKLTCATLGKVVAAKFKTEHIDLAVEFMQPSLQYNTSVRTRVLRYDVPARLRPVSALIHRTAVEDNRYCDAKDTGGPFLGLQNDAWNLTTLMGSPLVKNMDTTVSTADIVLFGDESVVQRSVALYNGSGVELNDRPMECRSIAHTVEVTKLEGMFIRHARTFCGGLRFWQPTYDHQAETSVKLRVFVCDETQRLVPNLGINIRRYNRIEERKSFACEQTWTGEVYNPFKRQFRDENACNSTTGNWGSCAAGALWEKHGPWDTPIRRENTTMFSDPYVALNGPQSIDGRSVVIDVHNFYDAGEGEWLNVSLDCARIVPVGQLAIAQSPADGFVAGAACIAFVGLLVFLVQRERIQ